MFRPNLLHSFRAFQRKNAAVLFPHGNSLICRLVRLSSSETERNSDRLISLLDRSRSDHKSSRTNGGLLDSFEYRTKRDRGRPKQEQMAGSFSIVRKINREADVEQLLELYEFVKNEENVEADNIAAISAQIALFSRFAALAEKDELNKSTHLHHVSTAAEDLLRMIRWRSKHFEHTQLASAVWHIAARGITEKSCFYHFEKEIRSRDSSVFTNKDLAMIMWGYGKAQFSSTLLFKYLRKEILARDLARFKIEEIGNILWAYVRTEEKSAMLFAAVKVEILKRDLKAFDESTLITLLCCYAADGVNIKPFLRKIKYEILRRGLPCFTYKQLSQIVGSYAQQKKSAPNQQKKSAPDQQKNSAPDLFQAVSLEFTQHRELSNFEPAWLVIIADSFARTENYIRDVFKAIEYHILDDDLSAYEPLQVVTLFWAFTEAGFLTESLHDKLSNKILLCDLSTFKDTSLEELVKALESNHFKAPTLVAATEAELVRRSEAKL